ncbi:MAG: hypothetical protein EPN21_01180 [Methylococcaceae bacterium]|nr:MAG: hypothetical protein EPN21_01180 [Methylococcaceae bacterium]
MSLFLHTTRGILFWLACISAGWAAVPDIGPAEVYTQALLIEQETEIIRRHFNITTKITYTPLQTEVKPRHVWQKTYQLLMKINVFRRLHGLTSIAPTATEPMSNVEARMVWSQTQRILTEIRILRRHLGIPGEPVSTPHPEEKKPLDVYNKLNEILALWGGLIGAGFTPSHVYSEVLRLNKDVDGILLQLKIFDSAAPPPRKEEADVNETLGLAFEVMDEIQRLQRLANIETTDFSALHKTEGIVPADVFNLIDMALAELDTIKAKIGLIHSVTPIAEYFEDKTPADVAQTLGYLANKLRLIKSLRTD